MNKVNDKLSQKWEDAKKFVHDSATKEKAQEMYGKVKNETVHLFDKTKEKINEVKEDERFKDFLNSASDTIDSTIQTIQDSEVYAKVKDNVSSTLDSIKKDEKLNTGVKKAKKATLNFAKKALSGIERILDDEASENNVVVYEIRDDHESE